MGIITSAPLPADVNIGNNASLSTPHKLVDCAAKVTFASFATIIIFVWVDKNEHFYGY